MRTPSIKTLSLVFGSPNHAKQILGMARFELLATPEGIAYHDWCYNSPDTEMIRMHTLDSIEPGLHGIEALESAAGECADYLNAGDSYAPTLIYWRGRYRVQSVGDFVETMERRGIRFP